MRVAIYVRGFAPEAGGAHTYERDILDAVAAARDTTSHDIIALGHEVSPPRGWDQTSYLSLHLDVRRRITAEIQRSNVWRAGLARGELRPPGLRFDALLESRAIDLVWCVGGESPARDLPYVTTVWDLQHRRQPVFPEVSANSEWLRRERYFSREIGRAAAVIVGTAAGQAEVERFYGVSPERIRKLPHPTPSFALDSALEGEDDVLVRYGVEPGYVLYPAQFWPHKNHVGLLHALSLLRDEHNLRLPAVLVGSDKGNEDQVRRVAHRLKLDEQVSFLGFVPRSDLVRLYQHAFALAYVTYFGPENLPPLEAFALGCPVVASDVPGAEEQLGDAALLVPPTSAPRIAEALLTLHRDDATRQRLIERGHERALSYTPRQFVKGMITILDELEPVLRTWR